MIRALVTMPPYAPFLDEVLDHPLVSGIRLNTVMPLREPIRETLTRLKGAAQAHGDKELWIDLKGRQLRVNGYGSPPFTAIELDQDITVDTPVEAVFANGRERCTVVGVDGRRLIMLEGPRRLVGPGESVNIVSPSLRVTGYLTDLDRRYAQACAELDISRIMLSFFEGPADLEELRRLLPAARVVAKIESQRGLAYVAGHPACEVRLMAARGDLFIELPRPHQIVAALRAILRCDADAIVASRLFSSLSTSLEPSCEDIGDVAHLLTLGYRTFLFGDDICQQRESILSALNLLRAITGA